MPVVIAGFLRLVTHPRIFRQPTPVEDATAFIDALSGAPGVEMPAQGVEWPLLRQLCIEGRLSANDIPDAWLAASVMHLGEHLVTFDADFKRLLRRSHLTLLAAS
jgi:predicted nucleic acid-binding protein